LPLLVQGTRATPRIARQLFTRIKKTLAQMKLSILIVNFNSKTHLLPCLDSIYENIDGISFEVIVVDNNSDDKNNLDELKKYSHLTFFQLDENIGFGGGNNFAASKATGEYLLLLNPDTLIEKSSIEQMLDFATKRSEIGIVGPMIAVQKDGPAEKDFYGDFPTLNSVISRNNQRKIVGEDNIYLAERVTGACMLIRRELFEKIGGFDTKFFMYFEDTDLCKRVSKLGYKNAVLKTAEIIHFGGTSQTETERKKEYYKAQDYFFKKHYGVVVMLVLKLMRIPYRMVRS